MTVHRSSAGDYTIYYISWYIRVTVRVVRPRDGVRVVVRVSSLTVAYTVATPNFVSSYRLQPVVNDSDLLSRRDFAPLTHRIC